MERKYETKSVKSCVFVNYEDSEAGIVMPSDTPRMFNHLNGSVVILNREDESKKIIEIKPLLWTGYQDANGLDLYDCDKVRFNQDSKGVIHWINGGFFVVEDNVKSVTSISNCKFMVKVGNELLDAAKASDKDTISDAELVQESK